MYPVTYKLFISVILIITIILIRWLLNNIIFPRLIKPQQHYAWRKIIVYSSSLLLIVALVTLWVEEFGAAATFLGLLSAGLAVALKDPIVNLFGWFHIIFNRPFEVGHRIEINNKNGDVLDINFFEFTILETGEYIDGNQSTGRIVHIPNGKVFNQPIVNAVQGFQYIWNEVPVLITFESDWKKAKEILLNIEQQTAQDIEPIKEELNEGERRYNVQYKVLSPTVYTSVKPNGIQLTLRFLCHPKRQRSTEQAIWEEILRYFENESNIQFAYPTMALHIHKTINETP